MAVIGPTTSIQNKRRILSTLSFIAISLFLLCAPAHASPLRALDPAAESLDFALVKRQSQPNDPLYLNDEYYIYNGVVTTTAGIVGSIFIIIGIFLGTLGFRGFRFTLGVIGLLLFAIITYVALVNAEPNWGYSAPNHVIFTAIPFGLGLLGAVAFMLFWFVSIYFVGGLGGFFLILYILAFKSDHIIAQPVARYCVLVGFFFLGFILTFIAERIVVIIATSFIGAYLFMFGLDIFVHAGFVNSARSLLDGNYHGYNYTLDWRVYVELAFVALLAVLFCIGQFIMNRGRKFGTEPVKPRH